MNCKGLCELISCISGCLGVILSIAALFVAWRTLRKTTEIASNQQWNTLVTEYRSTEFGIAVKAICDFYIDDCNSDFNNIRAKYKERYVRDMKLVKYRRINMKDTLHFQRRLVSQYYWHLENYFQSKKNEREIKKIAEQYFSKKEINIIAIVYEMNNTVDKDETIYRKLKFVQDISIESDNVALMNKNLLSLHKQFKEIFDKKNA